MVPISAVCASVSVIAARWRDSTSAGVPSNGPAMPVAVTFKCTETCPLGNLVRLGWVSQPMIRSPEGVVSSGLSRM
ncbi:hypothetical protein D3C83_239350 [compost metagenome]